MNLLICVFFLFLIGIPGILAKDEDQSSESVILHLNSLLSKMVQSDDLDTYRNLSTEALKLTQDYFKNEKATAVPIDEEDSTKIEDYDKLVGNNTEEKSDDNDGTRRHTFDEEDDKLCDTLFHNIDVALRLVELNLIEMKAHPTCVHGRSIRGKQIEIEIIKMALDKWPKQQLDSEMAIRNPDLKPDFIVLASVLAPGFTPTPSQVQRLETILKRPVFVNILHSHPDLCYGYQFTPQVNVVNMPSVDKIPMPYPGKLEVKDQYYISPQRPYSIPSNSDTDKPYSKYEKIVLKPDTVNVLTKPKNLWPLVFNANDIPSNELNKIIQIHSGDLTPKILDEAPLIKSTPISEQLWKLLLNKIENSDRPRPELYPKIIKTPNGREELKRLLAELGQTPAKLPKKIEAVPYQDMNYPIETKQIAIPPPIFIEAQPIRSKEIMDLHKKHLPSKIRDIRPKIYGAPLNKPLAIPIDDLPMRPKKPIDISQYPYQQKPRPLDEYSINLNVPQPTDYLGRPMKKKMKYPPSLFPNVPHKSQKYDLNDDLPKPNIIVQDVKPNYEKSIYYNNPQKLPVHNIEIYKKYPELLPNKKKTVYHTLSPLDKYKKPNYYNHDFKKPKKININDWPHERPADLEYPNDIHKIPKPDFLYGGNDGNRDETIYPDYDDHRFVETPPKPIIVDSSIYKKTVKPKHQRPLHPIIIEKEEKNYYNDLNNNDRDEYGPKFLINEFKHKGKRPIINKISPFPNNNHVKPYIQRPAKFKNKQNSKEKIRPVYQDDNTKPLPWTIVEQDLYETSPNKPYYDYEKISQIKPKLPIDLTLETIKQKYPKWLQIPNSFNSDGIGLGITENFGQNSQYNENPFKNSYQIDDLLTKTPSELLQGGGGTNWFKLAASRPSQTEVELIFLMKAQEPIIYWPVYYLSYRLPTTTLINKLKTKPLNKPLLTSTDHILYELVNSEPYAAISPELEKLHTEELYRLLVRNGLIVAANIYRNNHKINSEDYLITWDKIINNPTKYYRSGPLRSEDISEYLKIYQNDSFASLNDKERGRRLLARYFYRPGTTYHKFKPVILSPHAYKSQALERLRNIQDIQQLQGQEGLRYNIYQSRLNAQTLFNNDTTESSEDISEVLNFDHNDSLASLNDKEGGRSLLARYFYRPGTTYHKFKPAIISPHAYKSQALERLRNIQALKQLQGQQGLQYNVLQGRLNAQTLSNNDTPESSEGSSEVMDFDQNDSLSSLSEKDRGRRLLARYFYRPGTTYHKFKPAMISPHAYKLQALKRLRNIQAIKQLQRQQGLRYNILQSRLNAQTLFNNATTESSKIKENSPVIIESHNKNANDIKNDIQTINIHLGSSAKDETKEVTLEKTDDDKIVTITAQTKRAEDLTVRGLRNTEENSNDRFQPSIFDFEVKNNTGRSDTPAIGPTNESYTTITLNVTEETAKKPLDDFLIY